MTTDPKQQGGPRDVCERCQRPQFSDIQDAVSHHFDRAFCADIKGSPAGQCECRDHTIEQLRRQIARHSVCVVCRCDLILSSEAPHCFDCVPTDEQRDEWEAAGPVGESPPIDPRPLCIRCGQRWVPNEGVDATVTACCETMEEPTSRPTGPGDDTLEGWELSFHNGAPIAFRDDESVILKHDHALDIETCGPALRLPLPVLRHLGVDLAAGRASLAGENAELRREVTALRLQHSTALNAARLHVKRLVDAAIACRDMAESDDERYDFEMMRLDREGILEIIGELMRDPRALDEPEPTETEVNGGPADIGF